MVHDGERVGGAACQASFEPGVGVGALHAHVARDGELRRRVGGRQAIRLIGPDVGPQAQPLVGCPEIPRVHGARGPRAHP